MAKVKTAFFCQNCGNQYAKWVGQCSACKQWNTVVEELVQKEEKTGGIFSSTKQLRQIFFVDETNIDSLERHVSEVNQYLIGSHKVVQYLNAEKPEYIKKLKIAPITF